MPILIEYFLIELIGPFLLAMISSMFILDLLFYLLSFLNNIFVQQIGLENSIKLFIYYQPSLLVLALPIGFLTAILIVFGRMSMDREISAISASGISLWTIIVPVLTASALFSFFLVIVMNVLLPWGNTSYVKLEYAILSRQESVLIHKKEFIKHFNRYVLYVNKKEDSKNELKNVVVFFTNRKENPYRVIIAKLGRFIKNSNQNLILELKDGFIQQLGKTLKNKILLSQMIVMKFHQCNLDLNHNYSKFSSENFENPLNIDMKELALKIQHASKKHEVNSSIRNMEMEYYKKTSIPFSALAFAFIGIPLGIKMQSGIYLGPILASGLVLVYNFFILYGQTSSPMGLISPFWSMWLPNVILMVVGVALLLIPSIMLFIRKRTKIEN
jgi:lipopolysaccharide export system permease protein